MEIFLICPDIDGDEALIDDHYALIDSEIEL